MARRSEAPRSPGAAPPRPTRRDAIAALFPPRPCVPPRTRIVSTEQTAFGSREIVTYDVARGERVRAILLVPRGGGRRPGILASHQHAREYWLGKSEPAGLSADARFHYGLELCRQGFVVLCPDHLGFEERQLGARPGRGGVAQDGRADEAVLFADALLHGSSLAARYLFDLQQALDVLCAEPRVDATRIGAIGHSLGGQTTLWLAFHDLRVRASFASCGFSTLAAVQARGIAHNFASYLPGLLCVGDMDDVVAAVAPRAFGMSHGRDDAIFPFEGVQRIRARARRAFPPGRFLSLALPGGHDFPAEARRQAYGFLRRHLGTPEGSAALR